MLLPHSRSVSVRTDPPHNTFGKSGHIKSHRVLYRAVPFGTVAVEHFAPYHQVSLAAVLLDELGHAVAALAVALGALDAQHIELALYIAEDDVTAGHEVILHRYRETRLLGLDPRSAAVLPFNLD